MRNQALIDWSARLTTVYEERIRNELHIIEAMENGMMRSWKNDQDTTAESFERSREAVEAYREGIQIMAEAKAELAAEG